MLTNLLRISGFPFIVTLGDGLEIVLAVFIVALAATGVAGEALADMPVLTRGCEIKVLARLDCLLA
jgi:hypothetical protein